MTEYIFTIEAYWEIHQDQPSMKMAGHSFFIGDFCAAMSLNIPWTEKDEATHFNLTMLTPSPYNATQGNWTEPLVFNISKYLRSDESSFLMQYISYTKFQPPTATWAPVVNAECGNLIYEWVYYSYNETWKNNDLLYKPTEPDEFFEEEGTRYYLEAYDRYQIGDHV